MTVPPTEIIQSMLILRGEGMWARGSTFAGLEPARVSRRTANILNRNSWMENRLFDGC